MSKVLVVDDEPIIQKVIKNILEGVGITDVTFATNGLEGLEKVRSDQFDLVITDFIMPRLKGPDFFHQVRSEGNQTPFILMSGTLRKEEGEQFVVRGFSAVLSKPFTISELTSTVQEVLSQVAPA